MVVVTPDSVRKRVNLTAAQVPDSEVEEFIEDAVATLFTETGETIDPDDAQLSRQCLLKKC